MNFVLPSVAPIMIFRSFIMLGFFITLFGWLHYKFQIQSVGDLAVYFDTMNQNFEVGALRDVQLGAVLAANKRLIGYIIIAGLGVLTFVLCHSFGVERRSNIIHNFKFIKPMKAITINQDSVYAKILALSVIYAKEESGRRVFLEQITYTRHEMRAVINTVRDDCEFRSWIERSIPLMQCRDKTNKMSPHFKYL